MLIKSTTGLCPLLNNAVAGVLCRDDGRRASIRGSSSRSSSQEDVKGALPPASPASEPPLTTYRFHRVAFDVLLPAAEVRPA